LRHPLFQIRALSFDPHPRIALLLQLLHRVPADLALLLQASELLLETVALAAPTVHLALQFRGAAFEVGECFFERGGELLLGEEVLFDGADAGFLVFDELCLGNVFACVAGCRW